MAGMEDSELPLPPPLPPHVELRIQRDLAKQSKSRYLVEQIVDGMTPGGNIHLKKESDGWDEDSTPELTKKELEFLQDQKVLGFPKDAWNKKF